MINLLYRQEGYKKVLYNGNFKMHLILTMNTNKNNNKKENNSKKENNNNIK